MKQMCKRMQNKWKDLKQADDTLILDLELCTEHAEDMSVKQMEDDMLAALPTEERHMPYTTSTKSMLKVTKLPAMACIDATLQQDVESVGPEATHRRFFEFSKVLEACLWFYPPRKVEPRPQTVLGKL